MDGTLPLFALGTVLFPDMLMPLHIFEPRYRLLVHRSLERGSEFGVVLIKSGLEVGGGAEPHHIGTTAAIVGHTPLPDGRSFIVVRGGRRFAIDELDVADEPYAVGRVSFLDEDDGTGAEALADAAADRYAEYVNGILAATNEPRTDVAGVAELREGTPRDVAYRIASGLAIEESERQRLLETSAVAERLQAEVRLLERENALLKELIVRMRARGESPPLN